MDKRVFYTATALGILSALLLAQVVHGQRSGQQIRQLKEVGIDEQLGETIPLDLTFKNADGVAVRLEKYLDGERPVILDLAYFDCPMLCPLMLQGLTKTLKKMSWKPGQQFEVLTVSFNPREGAKLARQTKKTYVQMLGKPKAAQGWHFLTGENASIDRLTDAVGFNYRWIEDKKQYAHPAALIFLSGKGKVSRYVYGLGPPNLTPGKIRKALVEASNGMVGNVIDQAILYCFQYNPDSNSYELAFGIMRLGGTLTLILLGGALFYFWRREVRKTAEGPTYDMLQGNIKNETNGT